MQTDFVPKPRRTFPPNPTYHGARNFKSRSRLSKSLVRENASARRANPAFSPYYFGARYLDPKYSRWMSADPALQDYMPANSEQAKKLGGMGGIYNLVNLNLYHYGANNPLKYKDPTGMEDEEIQKGVDLSLHDPKSQNAKNAANYPRNENEYIIGGHGDSNFIYLEKGSDAEKLGLKSGDFDENGFAKVTPNQLAEFVKNDPGAYNEDGSMKQMVLMSCNTGNGGEDSFAQKFADALGEGASVTAPDNMMWSYPSGFTMVAPPLADNPKYPDPNNQGAMLPFFGRKKE